MRMVPDDDRERGFTLVETIAVVVILGLIVVPLCTTMTQVLTLVPQSGRRTSSATDLSRLGQVFSDDVAQAQAVLTATNDGSWTLGNTRLYELNDNNGPLQYIATSVTGVLKCGDSATHLAMFQTRDRTNDRIASDGSIQTAAAITQVDWTVSYTASPTNSNRQAVTLTRTTTGATSSTDTYLTNTYCVTGQPVIEVTATPAVSATPKDMHISMKLEDLVDSSGNAIALSGDSSGAATLDGAVRVQAS